MLPWNTEDLLFDETRFNGTVRLFPLPDLVMFPNVMQPLHIYEPRYREMLNEALDSDGLIAMSVLAPGWEADYEGRPPLLPHACLGKIITHERTDNGEYNLLLLGVRRVLIDEELPPEQSFRKANVTLLDDCFETEADEHRAGLQIALTRRFQENLPDCQSANPPILELLSAEIPLSVLTDLVSFALPLEYQLKCELLGETDIDRRAWMLLDALEEKRAVNPKRTPKSLAGYLPPFSVN
ncbi:MAG: LON peptidase substrate-binding domain-containing protein [Planctomycetales bacterium]|nr:LON peptidase substrate-binding domain-containing protein [Planctomycetales bacterium]